MAGTRQGEASPSQHPGGGTRPHAATPDVPTVCDCVYTSRSAAFCGAGPRTPARKPQKQGLAPGPAWQRLPPGLLSQVRPGGHLPPQRLVQASSELHGPRAFPDSSGAESAMCGHFT